MGHEDVAMEYYVAEDQRPLEKCLKDVDACDLYVGVFAWRYGSVPEENNPSQLSITELEYREAVKAGKTCLVFLLDNEAAWPTKFVDRDRGRIERLRDELKEEHVCDYFSSADSLGRVVAEAIYKWAKSTGEMASRAPILEFESYHEAIRKRYQMVALEGLTPPQKEEYLQMQLRSVFVEQNVREETPPMELPKELWEKLNRERDIVDEDFPEGITLDDIRRARETYYGKPSQPVLDVVTDPRYQQLVILGDPGSGKSTLTRYISLSLVESTGDERVRTAFSGYCPILIELRDYVSLCGQAKCETFLEFLEYLGHTEGWRMKESELSHYLKADGRAVVIFDGLDEVFDPQERERITNRIAGFCLQFPKTRAIVTSRIIGYQRKILKDAGFAHFTLQDLDQDQVGKFIRDWYSIALDDRSDDVEDRCNRILRAFEESSSIRQLSGNPMLLTIMVIIGKHQELPRERWKLYDHAASVLIQHWDVNKHLRDESVEADFVGEEDKKELLRRLAYRMQAAGGGLAGNHIHREQLQAEFEEYLRERWKQPPDRSSIVARTMIDQFRERNFILSLYGANVYGFVHRAFLEYFCATAFVRRFEKSQELTPDQLLRDVYGIHWREESWNEVLRLICGMIDERFAKEVIDYLASRPFVPFQGGTRHLPWNIALAVQCLGEVRNLNMVNGKRLLWAICSLLDVNLMVHYDVRIFLSQQIVPYVVAIGTRWPCRTILADWLAQHEARVPPFVYRDLFGKVVASVGAGSEEIHRAILDYASSSNKHRRHLAAVTLAEGWSGDPQTLHILRERLLGDSDASVRSAALNALGKNFHDDPWVLKTLHDHAVNDKDEVVRNEAIDQLGTWFLGDRQTKSLLRDRAVRDTNQDVRSAALYALSEDTGDPETCALVRDRAVNDRAEDVRHDSILLLEDGSFDPSLTLTILHDRFVNDRSAYVRSIVLSLLAESFRDDAETSILIESAVKDSDENVRRHALRALARHFQQNPNTLALVCKHAVEDPKAEVRAIALRTLADHFPENARTLALLRESSVNDEAPVARGGALQALADRFPDDVETLQLVHDRCVNDPSGSVRRVAIGVMAEHFPDERQTFPLLCEYAVKDPKAEVRVGALRALLAHFRDNPQTLALVHDRAQRDSSPEARQKDRLHCVREFAINAVAALWPEHADTVPLLRDRAENDPTEWLKEKAKVWLIALSVQPF
jgi:HEAT repeat protein/GTPase SAR1 family protein